MEKQKNMVMMKEPELWFSDVRGIYIPRDFAQFLDGNEKIEHNIPQEDIDVLLDPDHGLYWDVWEGVLESKFTVKDTGQVLELYQDGDLWVLPEGALGKIYDFEEVREGCLGLLGFASFEFEAEIESLEELEEYQDRFASLDDYLMAVEYFTNK